MRVKHVQVGGYLCWPSWLGWLYWFYAGSSVFNAGCAGFGCLADYAGLRELFNVYAGSAVQLSFTPVVLFKALQESALELWQSSIYDGYDGDSCWNILIEIF